MNLFRYDEIMVLRCATLADVDPVWRCRLALRDSAAIQSTSDENYDAHVLWFNNVINDSHHLFLIVEVNETWLGYLRFDPLKDQIGSRASIALVASARSAGIGTAALMKGCTKAEQLGFGPIFADIAIANDASRRTFEKCGFELLNIEISSTGFQRFVRNSSYNSHQNAGCTRKGLS